MATLTRWAQLASCALALVGARATASWAGSGTETSVHLQLRSSHPADGDTLPAAPTDVRLEFTQGVDPATSRLLLLSVDGSTSLEPRHDAGEDRVLVATLPRISDGAYRISWRVISPDGHPVSGDVVFYVLAHPERADTDEPFALPRAPHEGEHRGFPAVAAGLRGLAMSLQLALGGLLGFQLLLGSDPRLRRVAVALALVTPIVIAAHGVAWITSLGPPDTGTGHWLSSTLAGVGRAELLRFGLTALALWALVLAQRPGLAFALASLSVVTGAFIGHAVSFHAAWNVPLKGIHLAAVAAWLGGLLVLTLSTSSGDGHVEVERAKRVSSVALIAVIAVAVTGVGQTLAIVPEPLRLLGPRYGALLLAKIAGLAGLVGFGAYHRFRLIPRLAANPRRFRLSVRRELTLMGLVILLAGILGYVSPPESVDLPPVAVERSHE